MCPPRNRQKTNSLQREAVLDCGYQLLHRQRRVDHQTRAMARLMDL